MQIYTNEKLIRRYTLISRICLISGMVILIGGFYVSMKFPEQQSIVILALILGFLLSQTGILFTNRWSRQPRSDIQLNQALKGFDNRYSLFHFYTPASHFLIGPAGLWILLPRFHKGTITYSKGKWHQKGGNLYLKMFAQEGLGRPDLEIENEKDLILKYLKKIIPDITVPEINAALIFTNDKTVIDVRNDQNAPAVTLSLNKLKDHLRKVAKNKPISMDKAQEIQLKVISDKGLEKSSDDQHDAEKD
ncbi:MAG: hypothetical protein JW908_00225 [Anaerolineales bacterium]|nr:hypothetical protein [Anaerolineales bacterium]